MTPFPLIGELNNVTIVAFLWWDILEIELIELLEAEKNMWLQEEWVRHILNTKKWSKYGQTGKKSVENNLVQSHRRATVGTNCWNVNSDPNRLLQRGHCQMFARLLPGGAGIEPVCTVGRQQAGGDNVTLQCSTKKCWALPFRYLQTWTPFMETIFPIAVGSLSRTVCPAIQPTLLRISFEGHNNKCRVLSPNSPDPYPTEHMWDVLDKYVQSIEAPSRNIQDLKDQLVLVPDTTAHF